MRKRICDIDEIKAEMLKAGSQEVISFLVKLFNHVFDRGIYPSEWAKAIIVPYSLRKETPTKQTAIGESL